MDRETFFRNLYNLDFHEVEIQDYDTDCYANFQFVVEDRVLKLRPWPY